MTRKQLGGWAAWVLAAGLLVPTTVQADPLCDCPGSSYAPCHYHFPLLWRLGAHMHFHWHAAEEEPPPFSMSHYEYWSHCPYAPPASQLGFPSILQRSKLSQ